MKKQKLPVFTDIEDAAERLKNVAVKTPLLESAVLNDLAGGRVLIKPESLQRTGSFKFRGAYNFISRLDGDEGRNGVVAYSSGNHAQGVAAAAALHGVPALIIMPKDAPQMKIDNTIALGAQVEFYDRDKESREELGKKRMQERGAVLVPPYEHKYIIAGQGTVGLEIADVAGERGLLLDNVLVPASGGGLTAGTVLALGATMPECVVRTVEPEGFDDYARSVKLGARVANNLLSGSVCDALMAQEPGEMTFAINQKSLGEGLAVTDKEVIAAMRFAFEVLKLVVEPGGAVALAAMLAGRIDCRDRNIAIILSGGNIGADMFGRMITKAGQ